MRLKQSVFVSILAAAALVVASLFAPSIGVGPGWQGEDGDGTLEVDGG